MIATKILPSFYTLDLDGDAANLEFMIGSKHNINHISVNSADFSSDVGAGVAALAALDFFRQGLKLVNSVEELHFNPEFFPTQDAIEPTLQMLHDEERAAEQEDKLEEAGDVSAVILTRRFDEWGDFVAVKSNISSENANIAMKVAINPRRYLLEKNLEKQEHIARLHGQNFHEHPAVVH